MFIMPVGQPLSSLSLKDLQTRRIPHEWKLMVISASCYLKFPSWWKFGNRDWLLQTLSSSVLAGWFWALCFLQDCILNLEIRGLILVELRETSFVITRKTILERICVSCWKWVRVHKSRKVQNSVSGKSVLSQQSWTANSMGFSLAWFLCSASFQLVWSSESWNSRMENLFDSWCRWVKPFRLKDSEGLGKDFPFQMCWKVIAVLWCSQSECMGERREGRASCYSPELTLARCVGKGYLHFCNTAFPRSVARYNKANFFWKEMMWW